MCRRGPWSTPWFFSVCPPYPITNTSSDMWSLPITQETKESPSWRIRHGREEPAKDILEQLTSRAEIKEDDWSRLSTGV